MSSRYSHRDSKGVWHRYSADLSELIGDAERAGVPAVELPAVVGSDGEVRRFEVRFGAHARSARLSDPPNTGRIQVNLGTQATRIVRLDGEERTAGRPSFERGLARTTFEYASESEPLFGWLLRKQAKGWRKGSWQRRFFVLAPRSSALLYFTKGLHTRHVAMCRAADVSAPQAKGTIFLKDARIDPAPVDDDKPFSFSIRVPGAEYQIAARAESLKRKWLNQLDAVARGEPLGRKEPDLPLSVSAPPQRIPDFASRPTFTTSPSTAADVDFFPDVDVDDKRRRPTVHSSLPKISGIAPKDEAPPPAYEDGPAAPPFSESASEPRLRPDEQPDELGNLLTSLVVSKEGEAAEEHSECAVCFDELHARPVGVLTTDGGKRLCRHIVHLDCLRDLPDQPAPLCPMCRRKSAGVRPLPSVVAEPRTWFDLLDIEGTGRIEAEDVLATLKSQLKVREEELDANWDKIWDRFDLDHSGSLTFDELIDPDRGLLKVIAQIIGEDLDADPSAPGEHHHAAETDRHANAPDLTRDKTGWFEYWDDDGNGSLDEGELVRALVHSFNKAGRRDEVRAITEIVHALLAACDVEGDGLISREEFLAPQVGLADVIVGNFGFFNTSSAGASSPATVPAPAPAPAAAAAAAPPADATPPHLRDWTVELRTNGGSRYSTADLDVGPRSTVGELRVAAARLHNNMQPDRVRLINRGAQLRDDSLTLEAAGVRNHDSLMLIVASGGSRPSSDAPTPPPPYDTQSPPHFQHTQSAYLPEIPRPSPPRHSQSNYDARLSSASSNHQCRVTVPQNAGPGSTLTIRAPTGETLRVVVPPGYFSGSSFTIQYNAPGPAPGQPAAPRPPPSGPPPPPYTASPSQQRLSQQPTPPTTMRVKVPPGSGPGAALTVNVPGVGHCRVVVPPNVTENMFFEFRVPQRR